MPLYAFSCERCGDFTAWRRLEECAKPAYCPTCDGQAQRLFTPPNLQRTPPALRQALEVEEKSGHEPEVVTRPEGGFPGEHLHVHPDNPSFHRSKPPWVLGHSH